MAWRKSPFRRARFDLGAGERAKRRSVDLHFLRYRADRFGPPAGIRGLNPRSMSHTRHSLPNGRKLRAVPSHYGNPRSSLLCRYRGFQIAQITAARFVTKGRNEQQ